MTLLFPVPAGASIRFQSPLLSALGKQSKGKRTEEQAASICNTGVELHIPIDSAFGPKEGSLNSKQEAIFDPLRSVLETFRWLWTPHACLGLDLSLHSFPQLSVPLKALEHKSWGSGLPRPALASPAQADFLSALLVFWS